LNDYNKNGSIRQKKSRPPLPVRGSEKESRHHCHNQDTRAKAGLATLRGYEDRINHFSFSLDSRLLASASDDHMVIIWDMEQRQAQLLAPAGSNELIL